VLSSEKNSPCDAAGVLALEEKRLSLTVLETEDFAVATDVKLALNSNRQRISSTVSIYQFLHFIHSIYIVLAKFLPATIFIVYRTAKGFEEFGNSTFPG